MSTLSPRTAHARCLTTSVAVTTISALALAACGQGGPTAPAAVAPCVAAAAGSRAALNVADLLVESFATTAQASATLPCGLRPLFGTFTATKI